MDTYRFITIAVYTDKPTYCHPNQNIRLSEYLSGQPQHPAKPHFEAGENLLRFSRSAPLGSLEIAGARHKRTPPHCALFHDVTNIDKVLRSGMYSSYSPCPPLKPIHSHTITTVLGTLIRCYSKICTLRPKNLHIDTALISHARWPLLRPQMRSSPPSFNAQPQPPWTGLTTRPKLSGNR